MKIFLLDLWHDLRAKRLAPVAAVLALALVAVPVVLSKPSEEPAPPPTTARKAPDPKDLKALASVKLEQTDDRGSSLGVFDPSDPFRPPKKVTKRSKQESDVASSVEGETPSSGTGDTGAGGDTGNAGDTGGGTTGGGETPSTGGGDAPTTTVQYRYVVDVTFTANARKRHIKGMERLDMLPSQDSPLLLFLGVSANAGNAVFLVDSTLEAAGEGKCKPRASDCAFLYLGAGSEHEFTNEEGDSYTLRIDEIRKVKVDGSSAAASRSKSARAAIGSPAPRRRFLSPLADFETVSNGSETNSTDHQDRR
jgi:hypothetical protein